MSHENIPFPANSANERVVGGNDAWMIDGAPERAAETVRALAERLADMGWSGEQAERIEEGVQIGIENTLRYGNEGDAAKRIALDVSVAREPDGGETLAVAIAGASDRTGEGRPPVPDAEEAAAHGDRIGELFLRLPAGIDVEFFPEENRIVLKQKRVRAAS